MMRGSITSVVLWWLLVFFFDVFLFLFLSFGFKILCEQSVKLLFIFIVDWREQFGKMLLETVFFEIQWIWFFKIWWISSELRRLSTQNWSHIILLVYILLYQRITVIKVLFIWTSLLVWSLGRMCDEVQFSGSICVLVALGRYLIFLVALMIFSERGIFCIFKDCVFMFGVLSIFLSALCFQVIEDTNSWIDTCLTWSSFVFFEHIANHLYWLLHLFVSYLPCLSVVLKYLRRSFIVFDSFFHWTISYEGKLSLFLSFMSTKSNFL